MCIRVSFPVHGFHLYGFQLHRLHYVKCMQLGIATVQDCMLWQQWLHCSKSTIKNNTLPSQMLWFSFLQSDSSVSSFAKNGRFLAWSFFIYSVSFMVFHILVSCYIGGFYPSNKIMPLYIIYFVFRLYSFKAAVLFPVEYFVWKINTLCRCNKVL